MRSTGNTPYLILPLCIALILTPLTLLIVWIKIATVSHSTPLAFVPQTPLSLHSLSQGASIPLQSITGSINDVALAAHYTPPSPTPTPEPQVTPKQSQKNGAESDTKEAVVPVPLANPGGLNADTLFALVNNYRQRKGLPAFQKDSRSCSLAASRAPEINNEIATGTMHQGLKERNLPYWNTENIISMDSEQAAFNWWINDDIHRKAIEGNFTYSCVACSGNACAEEFTNYQPK